MFVVLNKTKLDEGYPLSDYAFGPFNSYDDACNYTQGLKLIDKHSGLNINDEYEIKELLID